LPEVDFKAELPDGLFKAGARGGGAGAAVTRPWGSGAGYRATSPGEKYVKILKVYP
jgi:hypothetical protein